MSDEQQWYYAVDGASQGPIGQTEFDTLIANGTIRPNTLVWREGMDDWLPLGQMPGASIPALPPRAPSFGGDNPARDDASTFIGALKDGLSRYVDFRTRSNRPQYWYFFLWTLIIGLLSSILDSILGTGTAEGGGIINGLSSLALLLPSLAVAVRRLHDTGRTGWWLLLIIVPIIGWIVLLVFYCLKGEEHPNRWGNPPA